MRNRALPNDENRRHDGGNRDLRERCNGDDPHTLANTCAWRWDVGIVVGRWGHIVRMMRIAGCRDPGRCMIGPDGLLLRMYDMSTRCHHVAGVREWWLAPRYEKPEGKTGGQESRVRTTDRVLASHIAIYISSWATASEPSRGSRSIRNSMNVVVHGWKRRTSPPGRTVERSRCPTKTPAGSNRSSLSEWSVAR